VTELRRRLAPGAAATALVVLLAAGACSPDTDGTTDDAAGSGASAGVPVSFATADDVGLTTTRRSADGEVTLTTLSSRASMVTGGDVLVAVDAPAGTEPTLRVNGEDRTSELSAVAPAADADGGVRLEGLVSGLVEGNNDLVATAGDASAELTVVNHPVAGPIFSGPHLSPWACETEFAGLEPATDDDCSAPTLTSWTVIDAAGLERPYTPGDPLPVDAATGVLDGETVPLVVRTEKSVINRGVATIWVLDPGAVDAPPATSADGTVTGSSVPWTPAYNGRLVYRFGGGCGTLFSQGAALSGLGGGLDPSLLTKGYAVATNTLNTFQTSCNPVLSAETMMMTREHFVKSYARPEFTIGDGGSGGAIQQLSIASNYPGALDGVSASLPYPDALSIAPGVTDCGLLLAYYRSDTGSALTDAQRRAINGHASTGTCESWSALFLSAIDPTVGCAPQLAEEVYDPATNPDGVRCTLPDINVNALGVDPDTGFAQRALDNVGVPYGLAALTDGVISVDEFLDLNASIGGYDIDGAIRPERTVATPRALATTYQVGALTDGAALVDIPVILRNIYLDPDGDIHTRVWPFDIRERMRAEDGTDAPNLVLWTDPGVGGAEALVGSVTGQLTGADRSVEAIDAWLTAGVRPASLANRCVLPNGTVLEGGWELYDEPGACADAYPVASDPRFVAGQRLGTTVLACELTPAEGTDFAASFTDAQRTRLVEVFPDGVCDWSRPGREAQNAVGRWLTFGR
jgi:hypothetical protein